MTATGPILTLASQSPRRRELLAPLAASLGYTLRLLPPDAEEDAEALEVVLPNEDPKEYVCRVTNLKADAGWRRLLEKGFEPGPLIASDTTVVLDDEILGKPTDASDARRMLQALSNRTHHVFTAVTLLAPRWAQDETQRGHAHQDSQKAFTQTQALSISEVHFGHLSDEWIERVIASGEPMDKAGAYAIQGQAAARIKEIKGSPSGVMGLPLFETSQLLESLKQPGF
jgi:septum formation protein